MLRRSSSLPGAEPLRFASVIPEFLTEKTASVHLNRDKTNRQRSSSKKRMQTGEGNAVLLTLLILPSSPIANTTMASLS